jgi:type IV pilus assembly protein PilM
VTVADVMGRLTSLVEGGALDSRVPPRYPAVAVEIAPDRITAVRVAADRRSGQVRLRAVESRPLPDGTIEVSLTRPNILAPEAVLTALASIFAKLGTVDSRLSLLLPDHVARVAILPFATIPRTRRELTELVRFRMSKSLPFKAEEAAMDLMLLGGPSAPGPAGASVLAAFIHRAVLQQYESILTGAGYWPGLVGLSTFELYNLFRPLLTSQRVPDRDALLLNVTTQYLSIIIFRDEDLIFYRCKPHGTDPGNGSDGLAEIRREIYTSLAFYQEKLLGRGIGRAYVRAAGLPADQVREAVAAETACEVDHLDALPVLPAVESLALDAEEAVLMAPAAGAAAGRRP